MTGLIMAAQLILGLSLLIILHELGHFLAARAFGIRVEKFYLFFDAWGFRLFHKKIGGTEFGIGWLPIGGYVKIAGMVDESLDTKKLSEPAQPWEFRSKPAWQRLIVMIAGVVMNLIVGMIIFTGIIMHYEKQYLPNANVANGVYAYETGRKLGFETGDKILAVNGDPIERFKDVTATNVLLGATITVERAGKPVDIKIPGDFYKTYSKGIRDYFIDAQNFPCVVDSILDTLWTNEKTYKISPAKIAGLKKGDIALSVDSTPVTCYGNLREQAWNHRGGTIPLSVLRGKDTVTLKLALDSTAYIGILCKMPYALKDYSFFAAVKYGISDAMGNLMANVRGLGKIISGKESARESIQGPIGIAKIYGGTWNWFRFWMITGLLSMVLAFMNILPIPALDGGHVIFTTIEMVTRKKFSDKFMERAQVVGMVILFAIMGFAIFNDFFKMIFGK
ncbi:MAG: RIP metalloprotease RseP [Bacteroidota bacterium]